MELLNPKMTYLTSVTGSELITKYGKFELCETHSYVKQLLIRSVAL